MAAYEERYCAFVDILGFRQLINKLRDGTTHAEALRKLLSQIHEPLHAKRKLYGDSGFRAQSISDAVALSTTVGIDGLAHLFFVLEELTLGLLFEGFFIRGAIVKGKLYHDEKMVFGEGLVEAHRLESNVVNYPRVMLVQDVVQDAKDLWNEGYKEQLRQAEDGPYYLHVLRALQNDIERELLNNKDVNAEDSDQLAYYVQIGRQIQKRFNEAVDNPRHFQKVQWFARYWNDIVCEHPVQGLNRIKGAGLDPKPAFWGS